MINEIQKQHADRTRHIDSRTLAVMHAMKPDAVNAPIDQPEPAEQLGMSATMQVAFTAKSGKKANHGRAFVHK